VEGLSDRHRGDQTQNMKTKTETETEGGEEYLPFLFLVFSLFPELWHGGHDGRHGAFHGRMRWNYLPHCCDEDKSRAITVELYPKYK